MKFIVFIFLILFLMSCGQGPVDKSQGPKEDSMRVYRPIWNKRSESEWLKTYSFKSSDVGYVLYDPEKKKILRAAELNEAFTPASVMKILTGYYALAQLTPEHRFVTRVVESVNGDIYLVGGGDPLLMSNQLMKMCVELKRSKNKISGQFYFDETLFASRLAIETSQSDEDSYNAGVSALSSDFNMFQVHYRYNKMDNALEYYFYPDVGQTFRLVREQDGGSWDAIDLEQTEWLVPMVKSSGKENIPLRQAGLATAMKLRQYCQNIGLELPYPKAKKAPLKSTEILNHKSIPLSEIVALGMEYSNNLIFETLLLNAANVEGPELANEKMRAFYQEKLNSKNRERSLIQIKNGSGLAHDSKLTPHYLLSVLKLWGDDAISYMPISGHKGTLSSRLHEQQLGMKVWAKTGTMDYVSSLAGTLFSDKGKKLIFVIMINNKSGNTATKENWRERARKLQDDLLVLWSREY